MSKLREPIPVKLVASLITNSQELTEEVLSHLQGGLGNIDLVSERMEFNHTGYYNDELGRGLFRRMVSFEKLISPDDLPGIKVFTNSIEERFSDNGKRRINIDPGYIALEKMVLASCKNFSHRIYLSNGVYADLTLIYRGKGFQTLEWTFPDYAELGMRDLLKKIRDGYQAALMNIVPLGAGDTTK
jgi:hypothetical protein